MRRFFKNSWLCTLFVLVSAGCSETKEGDYVTPPGFAQNPGVRIGRTPGAFAREDQQVIAAAQGGHEPLRALFHDDPTRGVRYYSRGQDNAFVDVVPLGVKPSSRGRVRDDGALLTYENIFEGVSAVYTVEGGRIEEFLSVPSADRLPELRYSLRYGPDFGRWSGDDKDGEGAFYAFSKQGRPLFKLHPPVVEDADGKRTTGRWEMAEVEGGSELRAQLDLSQVRYPLLIDPTFETVFWLVDATNEPPALAAAAGTYIDIGPAQEQKCELIFGGAKTGFALANDTYAHCLNGWQSGDITTGTRPAVRAYAALQFRTSDSKAYLFGGHDGSDPLDDFWALTVSGTTTKTGTWSQVPKGGAWPCARMMHGMARDGGDLLLFGGVDQAGALLTDTWRWDGSTWTQVCTGCFQGRYGFGSAQLSGTNTIYAFGGYDGAAMTSTVQRWTGSGWVTEAINPALIPTLATGALDTTANPPSSSTSPEGRYTAVLVQSGVDPDSVSTPARLLVASGVTSDGTTDRYIADAWLWNRDSGENRWIRQPVQANRFNLGRRESAVAVYNAAFGYTFFFGGISDASNLSTVMSRTRLRAGFRDSIDQLELRLTSGNNYILQASITTGGTPEAQEPIEGYFVRRDGDSWSTLSGAACGTSSTPLTATGSGSTYTLTCQVNAGVLAAYQAVGVRVRDRSYTLASATTAPTDLNNNPTCTPTGGGNAQTCHARTAYFGSATCGIPTTVSPLFSCPAVP